MIMALPKIELHRHLEGSLRLSTLAEIAQTYDLDVPARDEESLRPYVQIMPDSPHDAEHFLSKFAVLRGFYCAPDVIRRVACEAVEDAAADNIKYLELRFTPKALARIRGFAFTDVIDWVLEGVDEGKQGRDIVVRLILALNRHESVADAELAILAGLDRKDRGIVAVDLCGQEEGFPAEPFAPIFREAQKAGMHITIHGAEWDGPHNVRYAIEKLGASRIGHGVRIFEDPDVITLAREREVFFEVCPTSNLQSGVVKSLSAHPLRKMQKAGLRTTLNTDDPSICGITLTEEYYRTAQAQSLGIKDIQAMLMNAAEAAFIPEMARTVLISRLIEAFSTHDQTRRL